MSESTPSPLSMPVGLIPTDDPVRELEDGVALCLSGGGYRAMLFHVGVLMRVNDAGLLPKLDRISSVSGGSIAAAYLGLQWSTFEFDARGVVRNFDEAFVRGIREMGSQSIDTASILSGMLWFGTIGDKVASAYGEHLFGDATLQDLPDRPRFVINATNLQSGALWRFSKPYMWDWRVGKVRAPAVPLAKAVAASSAFPPVLSPFTLDLSDHVFEPNTGNDLQRPPYTKKAVLSDGGVYDNLGLETAYKRYSTILVSDAGGQMPPEPKPHTDWAFQSKRVLDVIDNQVRSLRKRQLIESYKSGARKGTYWGIRTNIADYGLADVLHAPHHKTMALAQISTRLKELPGELQERLINWGYAVCDAALRRHFDPSPDAPDGYPYDGGVG